MAIDDWTDLDLAYLLMFGEHPDLESPEDTASDVVDARVFPFPRAGNSGT